MDQCSYEAYHQGSACSSGSSIKLNRVSSTDGVNDFYSLNANQDIDTSFADFELERRDDLEGDVQEKEETYNNQNGLARGGDYDDVVYSPCAVSTSEEFEDENEFDSGISSIHLTPSDTADQSPKNNLTFSPELASLNQDNYDDQPSRIRAKSQLSPLYQSMEFKKSYRTQNRLAYSPSYPSTRPNSCILETRRQRVNRISMLSEENALSDVQDTSRRLNGDNRLYYEGKGNYIEEAERNYNSNVYLGDEYLLSPYVDISSYRSKSKIPQGYQMDVVSSTSYYSRKPLEEKHTAGIIFLKVLCSIASFQ